MPLRTSLPSSEWRASATPCPSAAACSMCDESLKIGPLDGSGQSRPAASNHGFQGSSFVRSSVKRARSARMLQAAPRQQARAAYREKSVVEQMLRCYARPIAVAVPDSDIGVVALEIDVRHVGSHVEIDIRIRCEKAADSRQQPARGERRDDAHPQEARVAARGDLIDRRRQFGEGGAHAARESFALVGQANPAARALA